MTNTQRRTAITTWAADGALVAMRHPAILIPSLALWVYFLAVQFAQSYVEHLGFSMRWFDLDAQALLILGSVPTFRAVALVLGLSAMIHIIISHRQQFRVLYTFYVFATLMFAAYPCVKSLVTSGAHPYLIPSLLIHSYFLVLPALIFFDKRHAARSLDRLNQLEAIDDLFITSDQIQERDELRTQALANTSPSGIRTWLLGPAVAVMFTTLLVQLDAQRVADDHIVLARQHLQTTASSYHVIFRDSNSALVLTSPEAKQLTFVPSLSELQASQSSGSAAEQLTR